MNQFFENKKRLFDKKIIPVQKFLDQFTGKGLRFFCLVPNPPRVDHCEVSETVKSIAFHDRSLPKSCNSLYVLSTHSAKPKSCLSRIGFFTSTTVVRPLKESMKTVISNRFWVQKEPVSIDQENSIDDYGCSKI